MIAYKDKTWCTEKTCISFGNGCSRALTEEVKKDAEKWWGKPGAPVYTLSERPDCYLTKE